MSRPTTWAEALATLAKPVPQKFIKIKPDASRAEYLPHHLGRQYLHAIFDDHRFETAQVIQKGDGDYAVRVKLHVRLGDEWREYEGWGESDNRKAPLKSAESDAVKRICAMHLGLGLSLWSREHYFLPGALAKNLEEAAAEAPETATYGGDGDEQLADAESPAASAPRGSEAPPSSGPHPTSPHSPVGAGDGEPNPPGGEGSPPSSPGGDGAGEGPSPSGEPTVDDAQQTLADVAGATPVLSDSAKADLRSKFFGIVKGLGLDYQTQVKPWMEAKRGGSVSDLLRDDPGKFVSLVEGLDPANQHARAENRQQFKAAVLEHLEAAA